MPSVTQNRRHSGVLALVAGGRGAAAPSRGFPHSPPPPGDPRHSLHSLSLQTPRCLPIKAPASDPRCPWRVWKQETLIANEGCFQVRRVISFPLQRALGVPAPESWAMFLPLELSSDLPEMRRHRFSPDQAKRGFHFQTCGAFDLEGSIWGFGKGEINSLSSSTHCLPLDAVCPD